MKHHGQIIKSLAVAALLGLPHATAADPWFSHEFGELRAYHGDFLNVCDGGGLGACRTVQYILPIGADPFFGTERFAIHARDNGDYALEFWARVLPSQPIGPFSIIIDGRAFDIPASAWLAGTPDGYNVSETISITDAAFANPIVRALRRGFFMRFGHDAGETVYSLRGLTSALNAISFKTKARNNDS